ncbi:hypothetical protein [Terribacillus sp. DMT04]|uniref:hypothetical protein n=1 Tax=Terribacillus sp. DMT04 TaxID=2850441 RepID=UPI001C2C0F82|nr:hypothetical protein [Terribacillus sp. DMT04]QXE01537.1 hypothetical protein KS242_16450 [Terribacillus sp. DMT04]
MKTYTVLFIFILLMHTMTLVNVTLFDGEWNGIVIWASSILFLAAVFFHAAEYQAHRKHKKKNQ